MGEIKITPLETKKLILKKDKEPKKEGAITVEKITVPADKEGSSVVIKPIEKQAEEPKEDVEAKVADAVKEQEVKEEPKPETTEPKAEPVAETPVAEKSGRFGVKFKDSMVVFDGKPEVGSKVKVIKVDNNGNLKVGDEGEITKPVAEGQAVYIKLSTGDHAGKVYHTAPISKLKTA